MKTKWLTILLSIVAVMFLVYAQKIAPPPDNGKVSDAQSVRILKIQLDMKNVEQQYQQVSQQVKSLADTYQHDQRELQQVLDDAVKEAGKNPEEWTVDASTLKFVEKPKAPAPKPETKKEK